MSSSLIRLLSRVALTVSVGTLAVVACTRTTDRVVEPVGGGDASTTSPEVNDASTTPIGPIAPVEPSEDFRLVRSPEFGTGIRRTVTEDAPRLQVGGGGNAGAAGTGIGGNDRRPVSSGGGY